MTPLETLRENAHTAFLHYVITMLWANSMCDLEECEDRENGGDCEHTNDAYGVWGIDDFSPEDVNSMREDVESFILSNFYDFMTYLETRDASDFGHDFALTRNGHGTGFWDRGLGELGERLSEAARVYGESTVYVSENGVSL